MRICDFAWSLWVICCLCSFWPCLGPMLMRGNFLWKMFYFDHGYVTCLYVPIYLVGDACTKFVAILLVYVSILACCSALCLFEKHILAFVDLIHALPTRGRKVPNSWGEKLGELYLFRGSLHSCFGSSLSPDYSCALLLMVSRPFASPWGVGNFGAFYLGCVEPLPLP